ncbi:MAG: hypothetical protein ACR2NN_22630 [Bryobacteraceae bacterium]
MMIEVAHRVAASLAVPVTADEDALAVMNAGAGGMNLEDARSTDETAQCHSASGKVDQRNSFLEMT